MVIGGFHGHGGTPKTLDGFPEHLIFRNGAHEQGYPVMTSETSIFDGHVLEIWEVQVNKGESVFGRDPTWWFQQKKMTSDDPIGG